MMVILKISHCSLVYFRSLDNMSHNSYFLLFTSRGQTSQPCFLLSITSIDELERKVKKKKKEQNLSKMMNF